MEQADDRLAFKSVNIKRRRQLLCHVDDVSRGEREQMGLSHLDSYREAKKYALITERRRRLLSHVD